jgi:hypothetical protein
MSTLKQVAQAAMDKQFRREVAKTKFRNVRVTVDGIDFQSKHEAHRYQELRLMEKAGMIRNLELQRPFALTVNGYPVCVYLADFTYDQLEKRGSGESWQMVTEDAKGMRTPVYVIKKKLMRAIYGIDILETRAQRSA